MSNHFVKKDKYDTILLYKTIKKEFNNFLETKNIKRKNSQDVIYKIKLIS